MTQSDQVLTSLFIKRMLKSYYLICTSLGILTQLPTSWLPEKKNFFQKLCSNLNSTTAVCVEKKTIVAYMSKQPTRITHLTNVICLKNVKCHRNVKKTSQELRMLSRSPSDCKSLLLNVTIKFRNLSVIVNYNTKSLIH